MDSKRLVLLFTFSALTFLITSQYSDGRLNDTTIHSRRKRFVVFPEGSTYSVSDFNLLQPTSYEMHQQAKYSRIVHSAHTVFMCFVFISVQTVTSASYYMNWLVFIGETKSVYCAVGTGFLNKAVCASALKV